jgi:hypothetical protein
MKPTANSTINWSQVFDTVSIPLRGLSKTLQFLVYQASERASCTHLATVTLSPFSTSTDPEHEQSGRTLNYVHETS